MTTIRTSAELRAATLVDGDRVEYEAIEAMIDGREYDDLNRSLRARGLRLIDDGGQRTVYAICCGGGGVLRACPSAEAHGCECEERSD